MKTKEKTAGNKISFIAFRICLCICICLSLCGCGHDNKTGQQTGEEIVVATAGDESVADAADDSAVDVADVSAVDAADDSAVDVTDNVIGAADDDNGVADAAESETGAVGNGGSDATDNSGSDAASADLTPLEVHFIDVGQGDATLIKCGNHYALIDAGNKHSGTTVQLYLHKQDVHVLDAVIWTHPDSDHIGGADVITTKYEIGTIYDNGTKPDTAVYGELADSMKYRWYSSKVPSFGDSIELGDATLTFLSEPALFDDNNDSSLICMVEHGQNRFLFTGDAEHSAEAQLVASGADIQADVYQAGHHGSASSSSQLLIDVVKPRFAVISCGEDNTYGHPHAEVMDRFAAADIQIYRTDKQGSIVAVSDGQDITWSTNPVEYDPEEEAMNEFPYTGNIKKNKLHLSSCNGLPAAHNRVYFNSLDEAAAAGFDEENQCHICWPYNNGGQ